MLPPLIEREKRILFFIRMWQWERGYSPNAREIGECFGVKRQTIAQVISNLKKKGYIHMSDDKDWRHRIICFPKGTMMPWGREDLPDYLFGHMKKHNTIETSA